MRVTEKMLENAAAELNRIVGSPVDAYTRNQDGQTVANIGCYHIDYAYGGVALHRMMSEGGGVEDVFRSGHMPKRELFERIDAYTQGIQEGRKCPAQAI